MERTSRFGGLDQHNETSDDDTSEDTRDHKKSRDKSSQKSEKSEQDTRRRQAGKGLFGLLEETKPVIDKKPDSVHAEKPLPVSHKVPTEKAEVPISDHAEQDTSNPEQLSDAERQLVMQNLLEAEDAALKQELQHTEPDSPQAAEATHVAAFIDAAMNRVGSGDQANEELLDEAMQDVIEELDLADVADPKSDEAVDDGGADHTESTPDDMDEEEADVDAPHATPQPGRGSGSTPPLPPPPPGGAGGAGAAGGGMPPPAGGAAGAARGGGFGGGAIPPPPAMGGAFPPTPGVPSAVHMNIEVPSRYRGRRELLVGGLVGYLIGRRHGRIKTEKRLLPVQKKLEKEVKELSDHIFAREEKIRKLTAEKHAREKAESAAQPAKAVEAKQSSKNQANETEPKDSKLKERPIEKLGAVLVPRPEKVPAAVYDKSAYVSASPRRTPEDLLKTARHIDIAGQNLEQLFDQNQLSKEDLEQAVLAYERGDQITLRRVEQKLDRVDVFSEDRFEKRLEDQAEKLKKLAAKDAVRSPAGDVPTAPQVMDDPYSPVQVINSQLTQVKTKAPDSRQPTSILVWTGVAVGLALVAGLLLFLFV